MESCPKHKLKWLSWEYSFVGNTAGNSVDWEGFRLMVSDVSVAF